MTFDSVFPNHVYHQYRTKFYLPQTIPENASMISNTSKTNQNPSQTLEFRKKIKQNPFRRREQLEKPHKHKSKTKGKQVKNNTLDL